MKSHFLDDLCRTYNFKNLTTKSTILILLISTSLYNPHFNTFNTQFAYYKKYNSN